MLIGCVELVELRDAGPHQRAAGDGVETRRVGEPGRRSARLQRARLGEVGVMEDVARVPGFRQQATRDRRGPLRLRDVIENRFAITGRLFREDRQPFLAAADDLVNLPLVIPLIRDRKFVARRHLPRAPHDIAVDPRIVDAWRAIVLERVRNLDERLLMASRTEPPQLVLHDRPARRAVEVVEVLDARAGRQAARSQPVVEVRPLQMPAVGGTAEEAGAVQGVAAVLRDQIEADAAGRRLGRHAARLVGCLRDERVVDVVLHGAVAQIRLRRHAVEQDRRVQRRVAVRRHVGLLGLLRAADVRYVQPDARHERTNRLDVSRAGNRVDEVARHDLLSRRVLDVDHRRLARHRHRLLERADPEVGVDRHGGVGGNDDAVALERAEPGQREGDLVGARPQIDDGVPAVAVGHHAARLLDENGTGRFHGDAGQDRSRRVLHEPGDCALRRGDRGQEREQRESGTGACDGDSPHGFLLGYGRTAR